MPAAVRNGVGRLKLLFRLLLLIGSGLPLLAQAQPNPGAALRQIEETQRREQERQQRDIDTLRQRTDKPSGIDTRELAPKPVAVPGAAETCRDINRIVIDDAPHLGKIIRDRLDRDFSGRCLNVSDLEQILGEITRDYMERGYIAVRAYLPAQDLSTGTLRILVVEGKVGSILIEDGGKRTVSIGNIFPGVRGDILDLRDLEQGLEQLNRLSSNNATMEIVPGAAAGVSDVRITNQASSPYHLIFSLDNQGSKSTGRDQAGVTGFVDNLLGIDEMLSATHRESVFGDGHGERSRSDTFNANVPFGYFLLSAGTSYSTYESTLDLAGGKRIANGSTRNHNALLDWVAYRDQASRLSFSIGLTNKDTKSYVADQYMDINSRVLTIVDADSNISTAIAGGLLRASFGYARGSGKFGALEDSPNLPAIAPHAQFEKYKYSLSFNYPFTWREIPWSASSALVGQHAVDSLYGSEQILIGGIYSVRGFVDNTLSGDHGYYWRNELAMQPTFTFGEEAIGSRIYVGVDYGDVRNINPDSPEGHLAGWGIGAQLFWRDTTFEIFNTRAISLPNSMEREGSQTWLRLSYSL